MGDMLLVINTLLLAHLVISYAIGEIHSSRHNQVQLMDSTKSTCGECSSN